jgi:hypothetical protein
LSLAPDVGQRHFPSCNLFPGGLSTAVANTGSGRVKSNYEDKAMKHLFAFIAVLALAGTLRSFQTGSAPQTAPAAPAGKTAEQQKSDESECIKWAKQQAGLSQPDAQQPAATNGSQNAGAAAANQGAAAASQGTAPANQSAAPANQGAAPANQAATGKSTDNAVQSATSSAINEAESKLGLGGVANSKVTELAKEAYSQCMQKKGYKTK